MNQGALSSYKNHLHSPQGSVAIAQLLCIAVKTGNDLLDPFAILDEPVIGHHLDSLSTESFESLALFLTMCVAPPSDNHDSFAFSMYFWPVTCPQVHRVISQMGPVVIDLLKRMVTDGRHSCQCDRALLRAFKFNEDPVWPVDDHSHTMKSGTHPEPSDFGREGLGITHA